MQIPAQLLQIANPAAASVREYWDSLGLGATRTDRSEPTGPTQRVHRGRRTRPQTRSRGVQRAQGAPGRGALRVLTRGTGAGRLVGTAASAHRHGTSEAGPSHRDRSPSPTLSIDSVGRALRDGDAA